MKDCEKYYKLSGDAIDMFYTPIVSLNDNYEYEKRKLLSKIAGLSEEDRISFFFSWQLIINATFLGLNKEKIENGINVNWDSYYPKFLNKYPHLKETRKSKIELFKDWMTVLDCKEKYINKDSSFWVKRIRDSFMHGNYEYKFNGRRPPYIKIKEGSDSSIDLNMDISFTGLNEFIEDNFHNVEHNDFGITNDHIELFSTDLVLINNREDLIKFLEEEVFIGKRRNKEGFYYNGNDIINSETLKVADRERKKKEISFVNNSMYFDTQSFIDPKIDLFKLTHESVELLVNVLEENNIYKTSKQKDKVFETIRQYIFPMACINKLLHEFGIYAGGMTIDKKGYKENGLDVKKMFAVLMREKVNIENAFLMIRLYRFLYKMQNKGLEDLDYKDLECNKLFVSFPEEDMKKRIEKNATKYGEEESENRAYIETIRNALAHGNVKIVYLLEKNKAVPAVLFNDCWESKKTGEKINISVMSYVKNVEKFLERVDFKESIYDFDEIKSMPSEKQKEKK